MNSITTATPVAGAPDTVKSAPATSTVFETSGDSAFDGANATQQAVHTQQSHALRILAVDDNALNLSVLSKLLRKRFSHMIDGAPVAVDSALKALQLMRENVFDVILMDIQMPFMSGVDCTERIRAGADGILETNRHATIIAVTTATGAEPEDVYRKAGFDGIIGKPVKVDVMQEFLAPVHTAAQHAIRHMAPIHLDGQFVTPAVPVVPLDGERVFFLPSTHRNSPLAPAITLSADFERLLKQQTRTSLHRFGAYAISRTGTLPGTCDRRRLRQYDDEADDSSPDNSVGASPCVVTSPVEQPTLDAGDASSRQGRQQSCERPSLHRRQASLTISQSRLQYQLRQELQAAQFADGERDGQNAQDTAERPHLRLLKSHRHSTPDVYQLEDLLQGLDPSSLAPPARDDVVTSGDSSAVEDASSDGFDSLSPLASPTRLHALMPSPLGSRVSRDISYHPRPKARPVQLSSVTPDRRRSSADQSTGSSSTSEDSDPASSYGGSRFDFGSNERCELTIAETAEEFDSPLTSPETEDDPPLFGRDAHGSDTRYCPGYYDCHDVSPAEPQDADCSMATETTRGRQAR